MHYQLFWILQWEYSVPSQYQMVAIIIPFQIMLNTPQSPYDDLTSKMINISGHPEVGHLGYFRHDHSYIFLLLFSSYFTLELGWDAHCRSPASYLGVILKWWYMKRHIINLDLDFFKAIAWQCFLAPALGGAIFIGYLELFRLLGLWPLISPSFPGMLILFPAAILLILLLVGMFLIYFPVVSYFAFWDERNLATFRRGFAFRTFTLADLAHVQNV